MSDIYAVFTLYNAKAPWTSGRSDGPELDSPFTKNLDPTWLFPVSLFGYAVEQKLNIGSSSTGAGAGKIMFDDMQFTRPIDSFSPRLFLMACSGTPFQYLDIYEVDTPDSGNPSTASARRYGLTAVKEIKAESKDTDSTQFDMSETVSFEYGQLTIEVPLTYDDGGHVATWAHGGWDRVKNRRL